MVMFCSIAGPDTLAAGKGAGERRCERSTPAHAGGRVPDRRRRSVAMRRDRFETLAPDALGGAELFGGVDARRRQAGPQDSFRYALPEARRTWPSIWTPDLRVRAARSGALARTRARGRAGTEALGSTRRSGKRPNEADSAHRRADQPRVRRGRRVDDGERFLDWWTRRADEAARWRPWLDLAPDAVPGAPRC